MNLKSQSGRFNMADFCQNHMLIPLRTPDLFGNGSIDCGKFIIRKNMKIWCRFKVIGGHLNEIFSV